MYDSESRTNANKFWSISRVSWFRSLAKITNNLFSESKEILSTHSTSWSLLLFPVIHIRRVNNNPIIINEKTREQQFLYPESPTNYVVQKHESDAHMNQPKDPKQQCVLLTQLWWNLEVRSPIAVTEYEQTNWKILSYSSWLYRRIEPLAKKGPSGIAYSGCYTPSVSSPRSDGGRLGESL